MTTIADGDTIKGPLNAMKKLEKAMKLFRKQYPKAKEFESKNSQTVFYDFKISDVSTTNSIMGLDDKAQQGIEKFIEKNIKGESSDSELAAILEEFLKVRSRRFRVSLHHFHQFHSFLMKAILQRVSP